MGSAAAKQSFTVEFKSFGKWRVVATRASLGEARTFVAERAALGADWTRTVRVIGSDGYTWAPGQSVAS